LSGEVMLFNLETAQRFNAKKRVNQEAFYKSMFNSFDQAIGFVETNGLRSIFKDRIRAVVETAWDQEWFNAEGLEDKVAS